MSVKIAEAYSDEKGNARGGLAGDQGAPGNTGKPSSGGEEVRVKNWYRRTGGWAVCLECTDVALGIAAAENASQIANDDSFGYDQDQRTTSYKAILAAGSIEGAADSEIDCSVLVFIAYKLAGLDIEIGYTGNLESRFMATGKFIAHREPKYLTSGDYAKRGWIYLTAGKHTMMVVSDGDGDADVPIEDGSGEADQIDPPYVQTIGKVNVRSAPGSYVDAKGKKRYNGGVIYTARNEKLPFEEIDDDTGWWGVMCPNGPGFVSCDIPNYASLVKE